MNLREWREWGRMAPFEVFEAFQEGRSGRSLFTSETDQDLQLVIRFDEDLFELLQSLFKR